MSVETADILTNALAVVLTLTMRSVFNILKRIWLSYWHRRSTRKAAKATAPTGSVPAAVSPSSTPAPVPSASRGAVPDPMHIQSSSLANNTVATNGVQADAGRPADPGHPREQLGTIEDERDPGQGLEDWYWSTLKNTRDIFKRLRPGGYTVGPKPFKMHDIWTDSKNFVDTVLSNFTRDVGKRLGENALLLLLMTVNYVGSIALGVFSSRLIISDSVALSNNPRCGLFFRPDLNNSQQPSFNGMVKYLYDFESECGQYAERCYNVSHGTDGCNFFYQQSFNYSIKHNDTCPFSSELGYLCHGGASSAFTMTTGRVEAKAAGINSPFPYSFQRSTTCSPLLMDQRFVRPFVQNHPSGRKYPGFRYFYGKRLGDLSCTMESNNCTFEIRRPSFEQKAFENTGYTMYGYSDDPTYPDDWEPIFQVNKAEGEVATLMFINNMGVMYPQKRDDPIFYANELVENTTSYFNNQMYAGVLGCMDRTMICPPNGGPCVSDIRQIGTNNTSTDESAVQYMLGIGMLWSTIGGSFRYRRAEALDAQAKVSNTYSIELAGEQWKVEAEQLFTTSLARIQIAIRNMARSNEPDRPVPEDQNYLPDHLRRICGMYKFRSVGWRNVRVAHLSGIVAGAMVLFIAGIMTDDNKLWSEEKIKQFGQSAFAKRLGNGVIGVGNWIKTKSKETGSAVGRRWGRLLGRGPYRVAAGSTPGRTRHRQRNST